MRRINSGTGNRFATGATMAVLWIAAQTVAGTSVNGNDFALSYAEAGNDVNRRAVLDAAGRRPHYFRYLQIVDMKESDSDGRREVTITALEPASGLDVVFVVNQRVSLSKLKESPVSGPGRGLAVSGVVKSVDSKNGTIVLSPVVVRHKDRLAPKVGKELYVELDDSGIFYTIMGDTESVSLRFRDRDLLRHRARLMAQGGEKGWIEFLLRETRLREAARQAGGGKP